MVSSILKWSAYGFGIASDDVRKSVFKYGESNEIKNSFSVSNMCRVTGSDIPLAQVNNNNKNRKSVFGWLPWL